jgi:3-deoxy-D-manno-octulosonic-acid transferase
MYIALSFFIYLLALPLLLIYSFKKKYRDAIPARFFLWKNPPLKANGIWFHVCSFGEAKAVSPLLASIPKEDLRMSCITHTGFGVIQEYTSQSRYLPFDPWLLVWARPQKALVVMEAELWYLLFLLLKRKGAKTLLINARISDRSFHRYQQFSWLYKQIFKNVDEVYAQTVKDKERLVLLGATNVVITGNIKTSMLPTVSRIWVKPKGTLVCAASTHRGEESLILEAFSHLKKEEPEAKLIIAPRHPERFASVAALLKGFSHEQHLSWQCYSEKEVMQSDIMLLDTLGELVNIYAISDVVILGGAFEPIGGHNAAEAAQFGCRMISGKHYFNQIDLFEAVEGIEIVENTDLSERLLHYKQLMPTRVQYRDGITPIIESLKKLEKKKEEIDGTSL